MEAQRTSPPRKAAKYHTNFARVDDLSCISHYRQSNLLLKLPFLVLDLVVVVDLVLVLFFLLTRVLVVIVFILTLVVVLFLICRLNLSVLFAWHVRDLCAVQIEVREGTQSLYKEQPCVSYEMFFFSSIRSAIRQAIHFVYFE